MPHETLEALKASIVKWQANAVATRKGDYKLWPDDCPLCVLFVDDNCKGRPIRVQLRRTKGWKMPPNTVKVDRSTRRGNHAAKIGEDISYYTAGCTCATAVDVVDLFRRCMESHRAADPEGFAKWIAPLRGKNLACWCPLDQPCHADVLLEIANG